MQNQFWASVVKPGSKSTFTVPDGYQLHLTQAVLPSDALDPSRTCVNTTNQGIKITIASLRLSKAEQVSLNLFFPPGHQIDLSVDGRNNVHLFGHQIPIAHSNQAGISAITANGDMQVTPVNQNKRKKAIVEDKQDQTAESLESTSETTQTPPPSAKKVKKDATPKTNEVAAPQTPKTPSTKTPSKALIKPVTPNPSMKDPSIQRLPNGLEIEEILVGTGKQVVDGRKVTVNYVGKLANGKKFDSGRNFSFRLGVGNVIKGWDIGLRGMRVGGKRILTIPASLGYGARGVPGIPGGATLIFDVELVEA